jgi:hypothetical protein
MTPFKIEDVIGAHVKQAFICFKPIENKCVVLGKRRVNILRPSVFYVVKLEMLPL